MSSVRCHTHRDGVTDLLAAIDKGAGRRGLGRALGLNTANEKNGEQCSEPDP